MNVSGTNTRLLDNKRDYNYFLQRSLNYHQLFNAETKFFHPKDSEGNFITPFDYRYSVEWVEGIIMAKIMDGLSLGCPP
jgi:putative alpha-1,2-mannosidase